MSVQFGAWLHTGNRKNDWKGNKEDGDGKESTKYMREIIKNSEPGRERVERTREDGEVRNYANA